MMCHTSLEQESALVQHGNKLVLCEHWWAVYFYSAEAEWHGSSALNCLNSLCPLEQGPPASCEKNNHGHTHAFDPCLVFQEEHPCHKATLQGKG